MSPKPKKAKCPECGKICKSQKGLKIHLKAHDPNIQMGRKPVPIDRKVVETLAAMQCTSREIASHFGVDHKTILNRFSPELAKGLHMGNISLRRKQYEQAVKDGNTTMLIWLGKQRLGQTEKQETTHEVGDRLERLWQEIGYESKGLPIRE